MAASAIRMYSGQPSTSLSTVYTASLAKEIVKEIIVCNPSTTTAYTITIKINGIAVLASRSIQPTETIILALSSVMYNGMTITAQASTSTILDVYISGVGGVA